MKKAYLILIFFLTTFSISAQQNTDQKLIVAVRAGNLKAVKNLVAAGAKLTAQDQNIQGYNALTWAAASGFDEIFKLLITRGAYLSKKRSPSLNSHVLNAVVSGDIETIKNRVNTRNVNEKDERGWTLLMFSSCFGRLEIVRYLIEIGADVNVRNSHNDTPLILAAGNGHYFVIKELVEKKAKLNLLNNAGRNAFIAGVISGNFEIAKFILNKMENYENAELIKAILNDNVSTVKKLITNEKSGTIKDISGWTPLMFASITGNPDILRHILKYKSGIDEKNKNGETALMLASKMGNTEAVKLILIHGAKIDIKNNYGWTALMQATLAGRLNVVKHLLLKGSDVTIKSDKLNAVEIAAESGNKRVYTVLKKHADESEETILHKTINWITAIYREIVTYLTAAGFLTLVLTIGSGIVIFIGLKILLKFLSRKIQLSKVKKELNRIAVLISLMVSFKLSNISVLNNFGVIFLWIFMIYYVFKISEYLIVEYYLIKKKNKYIPKIIRDIIKVLMFFILLVVLLRALDVSITGIALTSGGIAVGAGFALRDTFNNLIAGISISVEKPFRIGDWIKVKNEIIGEVIQTSWRTTRLLTLSRDLYIIPNTEISNSEFFNFYKPRQQHGILLTVGISYDHAPNLVKETIEKILLNTEGIISNPTPKVSLMNYNDSSMDYEIRYWISNYPDNIDIQDQVLSKIWYTFKRKDLVIPFPIRTVEFRKTKIEKERKPDYDLLKSCPIFENLGDDLLKEVIADFKRQRFGKDEIIVRYDEVGPGLFIIENGELDVITRDKYGNKRHVKKLQQGDFFGELSLLTGAKTKADVKALTDCELLFEERVAFKELVKKHPDLLVALSDVADSRLDEMLQLEEMSEMAGGEKPEIKKNVIKKIFDYFDDV